jgi:hypothetical protein
LTVAALYLFCTISLSTLVGRLEERIKRRR